MNEDLLDRRFESVAILVILRVLRRKKWLEPADMTDLRVAFEHGRVPEGLRDKVERLLGETLMEREAKKDTPHKPG